MLRLPSPSSPPPPWWADPVVAFGAIVAMALHGWAWFAGEYVPYIDYSNHLGLISILAHGGETGALAYVDRSLAPVPYLSFYAVSAAFAQVMSVPAACKASLLLSTGLCVYGGAFLAERSGRSPRLGLFTPLCLFGYALGYGFAAFVFTTPFLFFALGANEGLLEAVDEGDRTRRRWIELALAVFLLYIGHAFMFGVGAALIAFRSSAWALARLRGRPRLAARGWGLVALGALPTIVIGLPVLVMRLYGAPPTDDTPTEGPWISFASVSARFGRYGGDLLERGSSEHWTTMHLAAALFVLWVLLSLVRPNPARGPERRERSFGLELFALGGAALYLFGPESVNRPVAIWMLYPRFAVLAAGLVFLLPRPDLRGLLGLPAALLALGLVAHNAKITHAHMTRFNGWAEQYDPVRKLVPPKSRVLALSIPPQGDLLRYHPALGSLYFYHLADGAAYTAFLFDVPLLPVQPKKEGKPRAPFWKNVHGFDPKVHGKDFDYLVLRGPALTRRADASENHRRVGEANGWIVYETLDPSPKRGP